MATHRSRRPPTLSEDNRTAIGARGYVHDFAHLRICRTCYHLFEENRADGQNQMCARTQRTHLAALRLQRACATV
jgi:hypothetical protein